MRDAGLQNPAGDGPNAGYFYVCGSASTLAKDVTNVLGDLLSILTLSEAVIGWACVLRSVVSLMWVGGFWTEHLLCPSQTSTWTSSQYWLSNLFDAIF